MRNDNVMAYEACSFGGWSLHMASGRIQLHRLDYLNISLVAARDSLPLFSGWFECPLCRYCYRLNTAAELEDLGLMTLPTDQKMFESQQ